MNPDNQQRAEGRRAHVVTVTHTTSDTRLIHKSSFFITDSVAVALFGSSYSNFWAEYFSPPLTSACTGVL